MDSLVGDIIAFFKNEAKKGGDLGENLPVCLDIFETLYPNAKPTGEDLLRVHQAGLKIAQSEPKKPEQKPQTPKKSAEEEKNDGNEFLKNGNVEKAIECYERALTMDPNNHVYQANMGAAHYKGKNYKKAIQFFEKAVEIDPTYGKAYRWWAVCSKALNKLDEAIQVLKLGIDNTQQDPALVQQLQALEEEKKMMQEEEEEEGGEEDKRTEEQGAANPFGDLGGLAGGLGGLGGLLNNPGLMQMAQNFMQQPQFQQMMGSMMGNLGMQMPDFDKFEKMPEVQASQTLKQFIAEMKAAGMSGMPGVVMKWKGNEEVQAFLKKSGKDLLGGVDLGGLGSQLGGLFGGGRGGGSGGMNSNPSGFGGMFS